MKRVMTAAAVCVFALAAPAAAATINVPGDQPTIQAAITTAAPADIIQVAAGTYNEAVTVNKAVTIAGAGKGVTIIAQGLVLSAADGANRMVLKDLSVIAASSPYIGDTVYAIRIDATAGNTAPVTLENVAARSPLSASYVYGVGLFITANGNVVDDVVLTGCTVDGNCSN